MIIYNFLNYNLNNCFLLKEFYNNFIIIPVPELRKLNKKGRKSSIKEQMKGNEER